MQFPIEWTWDRQPLAPADQLHWTLTWTPEFLEVDVEAGYYADPPPIAAPGSCEGLWEFEVAELFLVGPGHRYLELELGPHGHHLLLHLEGIRRRVAVVENVDYRATILGDRWRGSARLPRAILPDPIVAYNTFAIHGSPRVYLAHHPVGGERPDFHRVDAFVPWPG